ncbi:hypothetical protein FACS1894206_06420 [Deltaproteobacteria bacterium]|nr:hypothetical protein FACS1894206_06420 [Deltaproteobacteria bacterium]
MMQTHNDDPVPPANPAGNRGGRKKQAESAAADLVLRRIPPHSVEAEAAVLGGEFLSSRRR